MCARPVLPGISQFRAPGRCLSAAGYPDARAERSRTSTEPARNGSAGSGLPRTDCLLLRGQMPGVGGLELQAKLREMDRRVPVIFVTAKADNEVRARAFRQGAAAFFTKPFSDDSLLEAIQAAMQKRLG